MKSTISSKWLVQDGGATGCFRNGGVNSEDRQEVVKFSTIARKAFDRLLSIKKDILRIPRDCSILAEEYRGAVTIVERDRNNVSHHN